MALLNKYLRMKNRKVSSYKELEATIEELKQSKVKQEELLKTNLREIKEALKPVNILKNALKKVVDDRTLHQGALKASMVIGAEYIVEKLFKTNKSPKRHFVATIFEKIVSGIVK
jgi:hypothetical protein